MISGRRHLPTEVDFWVKKKKKQNDVAVWGFFGVEDPGNQNPMRFFFDGVSSGETRTQRVSTSALLSLVSSHFMTILKKRICSLLHEREKPIQEPREWIFLRALSTEFILEDTSFR